MPGYNTLSFACPPWWGITNLLLKKFIENDVGNPKYFKIYCQKYQDMTPSPSERAGVRPPICNLNFAYKPYSSMAESWGEASDLLSNFCRKH